LEEFVIRANFIKKLSELKVTSSCTPALNVCSAVIHMENDGKFFHPAPDRALSVPLINETSEKKIVNSSFALLGIE